MRLAVLVDGENIAADHAAEIWQIAVSLAPPILSRVYGDAGKLAKWDAEVNFNLIHAGTGKNATDLLLCVEAMDCSLTNRCDALLIASSDRDFSHLALRLREKGLRVIGVGESKTSQKFRAACTAFHTLAPRLVAKPVPTPITLPQPALILVSKVAALPQTRLDEHIRAEIAQASLNGAGIEIAQLNIAMRQKHQLVISSLPEKNWRAYLSARPHLYALDPKGPAAKVRFLTKGFAPKAAVAS